MNYKKIDRFLSGIMILEAVFMIPALLICLYDNDVHVALCFLAAIAIAVLFTGILRLLGKRPQMGFH